MKWTSPISSRVLLEVGQSLAVQTFNFSYQPENGPLDIQHRSATTGLRTVASNTAPYHYFSRIWNTIANVSFVTGSHNIKAGINDQVGMQTSQIEAHGDTSVLIYVDQRDRRGHVADGDACSARRYTRQENLNANLGLFAQDKWTLSRLTLTYGARYDYFNASTPQQTAAAGRFMSPAAQAARANIAPVACLPCWNDWTIRGGASYDLFGTGKTALKMSVGKFLGQQALGLATDDQPAGRPERHARVDRRRPQRHDLRRRRQRAVQRARRDGEQQLRHPRPRQRRSSIRRCRGRPTGRRASRSSTRCSRACR